LAGLTALGAVVGRGLLRVRLGAVRPTKLSAFPGGGSGPE